MSKLTIYTGCMASGKSKALIRAHKSAPLDFDVYTFGKGEIVSRGAYASRLTAKEITSLNDVVQTKKNLIIDECQFDQNWSIEELVKLCDKYEKVYLAGLDWIQLTDELKQSYFTVTQFYRAIVTHLIEFPYLYSHYGLLAKNDITGALDARISKRYENATDILSKESYFNINFKQAFEDNLSKTK